MCRTSLKMSLTNLGRRLCSHGFPIGSGEGSGFPSPTHGSLWHCVISASVVRMDDSSHNMFLRVLFIRAIGVMFTSEWAVADD